MCYEPEFALDLEEVAKKAELAPEEVAQPPRRGRVPRADDRLRARPRLHGRARSEARGAAPRYAARRGAGGLGGDRERADGGLSVRDLGRLERHRPHADGAVRRFARAARACSGRATACASAPSRARSSSNGGVRNERAGAAAGPADDGAGRRPPRPPARRPVPGGAMDPVALALANALVGNPPSEAALEITVIGPELVFEQDTLVAVCGAEFQGSFPHNRPVLRAAGIALQRRPRGARRARLPRGRRRLRRRAGARQPQHLPAGALRRLRGPRAQARRRAAAARPGGGAALRHPEEDQGGHACNGRRRRSRCPTASRSWCT